jgi:hypothetical protein
MSTPQDPSNPGSQGDPGNSGWGAPPGDQQWRDQGPGDQQWRDQGPGNQQQWGDQGPGNQQQWGNQGYGQQGYGQQGYGGTPPAPKNGLGLAALIVGIIGLLLSIFVVGGIFGIAAVILGFIGRGNAKRGEATNGGQALGGIITGGLAILISIIVVIAGAAFFDQIRDCTDPALSQAEAEECIEDRLTNGGS